MYLNGEKIFMPKLTQKLKESLTSLCSGLACDRIAILSPYPPYNILAVINRRGEVFKPTDYMRDTSQFDPETEEYIWENKDFIWGKGYNRPIVKEIYYRSMVSECPPMSRDDGECEYTRLKECFFP